MWYLRKVASSCEQLGPVSKCLSPKYIKFCFKNLEIAEKMKTEVDRLLLVQKIEKLSP